MRCFFQISVALLLLTADIYAQNSKDSYSSASKLSEGIWFKIAITSDGIYRIDYSKLKQLGLENPSNPMIFGNNYGQLSYFNDAPKPDDLKEIAIQLYTGSDGIFNDGDYLLFFAKATGRWIYNQTTGQYDYLRHNYSDTAFYFLTSGPEPGKQIVDAIEPTEPASYNSSESDALFIHEQDNVNLIQSGREWFQEISTVHIDPGFSELMTLNTISELLQGPQFPQSSDYPMEAHSKKAFWLMASIYSTLPALMRRSLIQQVQFNPLQPHRLMILHFIITGKLEPMAGSIG
jgi:hypothetical protein